MNNKELLEALGYLSKSSIESIIYTMGLLKMGQIADVKEFPASLGSTLLIRTEDGKEYCFSMSEFDYVEIVTEGSLRGRVLYAPMDD